MKNKTVKEIVRKRYDKIARNTCSCGNSTCCSTTNNKIISEAIGYSKKDITEFSDANLGLGCGNPTAIANIKAGDTVVDLGSGAGFDCFLAAKKVGASGKVIGIDMTKSMIQKATENAKKYGYTNVTFRVGDIDNLPLDDNTIDVIISNCVINLSPDKSQVFNEAYRVLKQGGKMYVSDIVLLEELTVEQRQDKDLIAGCVGGALLRDNYISIIRKIGFDFKIISENKDISKKQYKNLPVESLSLEITK
jgi:SAM-dependent methyltransferase